MTEGDERVEEMNRTEQDRTGIKQMKGEMEMNR